MKLSKKLFGRNMTKFEWTTISLGLIASTSTLLSFSSKFFSTTSPQILEANKSPVGLIIGGVLMLFLALYLASDEKNALMVTIIGVTSVLLIINPILPFATVFNPTGDLGNIPILISECQEIGAIVIPSSLDCSPGMIEVGGSDNFICCLPDTCEGEWKRVYNSENKSFEKLCS